MIIEINPILNDTLSKLALENKLTSERYAANIINSFLESQYRASILDKIKLTKVEDLSLLKSEPINNLVKK